MIVKASHTIGLKILTIEQGKEIDNVQDVIYDPKENKVKALLVDTGGWFSDAKIIRIENVKSIGKDDVVIQNDAVIQKAKDVEEKVANIAKDDTYLTKTAVITEDGTKLGHVTDIFFDSNTGMVDEIEVSQGALGDMGSGKKRFRVSDIVTVGEDATIIKSYTEEKLQEQGQQQGIQGTLHHLQENTQEFLGKAKEGTQKAAQGLQKKTDEMTQHAQQKYHEVKESPEAKEKLEEARQRTAQVGNTAKQKTQQAGQFVQENAQNNQQNQNPPQSVAPKDQSESNTNDITFENIERITIPPSQAKHMSGILGGEAQQKKQRKKYRKTK